jgi:hypothetical protein
VNSAPRFASFAPFCRLICDHLLWPDIGPPARAEAGYGILIRGRDMLPNRCRGEPIQGMPIPVEVRPMQ